uniref:Orf20Fr n=1 Tax=Mesorhizobium sp. CJ1 TaxID=447687 RepID=A6N7W7_9HYPH|nr:Orf20Fr [Mesorhizobium sp. CJ1]
MAEFCAVRWCRTAQARPRRSTRYDGARRTLYAALHRLAGLLTIGQTKPGETVVVAAASGAVGSAVGIADGADNAPSCGKSWASMRLAITVPMTLPSS